MTEHDIDRIQSAIDHIKTSVDIDPWAMEIAVEAMREKMEHFRDGTKKMNDTIYRQDAIETVSKALKGTFVEYQEIAEKMVNKIPSAQPEIIHCKDCKWREDQKGSSAWLPCRALIVPDDFYCARAERREE